MFHVVHFLKRNAILFVTMMRQICHHGNMDEKTEQFRPTDIGQNLFFFAGAIKQKKRNRIDLRRKLQRDCLGSSSQAASMIFLQT